MTHIVLTEEQVQMVLRSSEPVDVRDTKGRTIGSLTPLTPAAVAALERAKRNRAAGGPAIPSARVQAFLRKLHELAASEGIDPARVEELLQRAQVGDL